jgi:hypothetical protein
VILLFIGWSFDFIAVQPVLFSQLLDKMFLYSYIRFFSLYAALTAMSTPRQNPGNGGK